MCVPSFPTSGCDYDCDYSCRVSHEYVTTSRPAELPPPPRPRLGVGMEIGDGESVGVCNVLLISVSIGNYGVPDPTTLDEFGMPKFFESDRIQVSGLVISSYCEEHSHWNANSSLSAWLIKHNVPAIFGVDTRALTKRIRVKGPSPPPPPSPSLSPSPSPNTITVTITPSLIGSMLGKLVVENNDIEFSDPNTRNLVAEVSRKEPTVYGDGNGKTKIVAVDLGIKNNIIRYLARAGISLKVVPWDYDFTQEDCDGEIFDH